MKKIRVLIIEDSSFMRLMIRDFLNEDPDIEVVGMENDGKAGIAAIQKLTPDVVTLDYEMPDMDGLEALKKIMGLCPTPVVFVSGYTPEGGRITLEALHHGAVDYLFKLPGPVSSRQELKLKEEITSKVKTASLVTQSKLKSLVKKSPKIVEKRKSASPKNLQVVAIGASTGGVEVIEEIIAALPADFPLPILIVLHMSKIISGFFVEHLNTFTELEVKEAEAGEKIKKGSIYLATGNHHMTVKPSTGDANLIHFSNADPVNGFRPSIDLMMQSVANVYGEHSVGILLSGMGVDGVKGMVAIHENGGLTFAQDEASSLIFGMPKEAIALGAIDEVLAADKIVPGLLNSLPS